MAGNLHIDASFKQKKLSTDKKNKMKINKEFAKKMGYNENKANFILAIAKARGKGTQTIICPKNKDFKPFLIINN